MEKYRFLVAVLFGTVFYVALSALGGTDGVWAAAQLREQKQLLSTHTALIEKTNNELLLEKIALQKDLDVIASYAKKLGYVSSKEKLVKISGLTLRETHIFDPGNVLHHQEIKFIPEWLCKASGFTIFALVYIVLFLFDYQRGTIKIPSFDFLNEEKNDEIILNRNIL